MTILLELVVLVTVCLGICIPLNHEEAEKVPMDDGRTILQWLKSRSNSDVEYYDVPFTSLDRFIHLAKVMEQEFTLMHYNQKNSSHLSEKIRLGVLNMNLSYSYAAEETNLLSDFQEENAEQLVKINRGVWLSTVVECYRFKWMSDMIFTHMVEKARHQRKLVGGKLEVLAANTTWYSASSPFLSENDCKGVQYAVVERPHLCVRNFAPCLDHSIVLRSALSCVQYYLCLRAAVIAFFFLHFSHLSYFEESWL